MGILERLIDAIDRRSSVKARQRRADAEYEAWVRDLADEARRRNWCRHR